MNFYEFRQESVDMPPDNHSDDK